MKKFALSAVTLATGLALTACGSSTVDSEEVSPTTSTQASSSSTTTATETSTATESESETTRSSSSRPAPAPGEDQPAQEVDAVPTQAPVFSTEEESFLESLSNQGISVQGVEAQLTGTGFSVCDGNTITRDAVAGQLIEQRRTELPVDAISKLIDDSAREHLC